MATSRSSWIGWWIVTGALLALVVVAVGCDRGDGDQSPADLLRTTPDGDVVDPPVPPPFEGAPAAGGRRIPPPLATGDPKPDRTGAPPRAGGSSPDRGGRDAPATSRDTSPVVVLRELEAAQKLFVRANHVDEDFDGTGEFGGLSELSRASGGRMGRPIREALIRRELGQLSARGEGRLGDYLYRVWLPGRFGIGIGELSGGAGAAQFEPNLAEDYWTCYAWPAHGSTGPTYFISQDGRLLSTDDPRYSGSGNGPQAGAALRRGEIEDMLAPPATNATGLDGNTWRTAR